MSNLASTLISTATAEIGYIEKKTNSQLDDKTANAGSNNYTKYARDLDNIEGFYNGKKNGYPWCDVFVDWCFVKSFGTTTALSLLCQNYGSCGAGCQYSAEYYKIKGQFGTTPKIGAQIFFKNTAGVVCHTGLVYAVSNSTVYTIEGNTSNKAILDVNGGSVAKKEYNINYSLIYGYGYPNFDEEITQNNGDFEMKTYKNGSTTENVYQTVSACKNKSGAIGSLNAYETCSCMGIIDGVYLVVYTAGNTKKTGFVNYSGGVK